MATRRAIAELTPDPENPRVHSEENKAAIRTSLADFGAGRSILLASDGQVIAGNATLEAAQAQGFSDVLVVETDGTTLVAVQRTDLASDSAEAKGLAVADNRAAELGSWDHERLTALAEGGMDLTSYGWSQDVLTELLQTVDILNPPQVNSSDATPEIPDDASTWVEPGDLIALGPHRLLCGSCEDERDLETVLRATRDEPSVAMVFADPPYGIDYLSRVRITKTVHKTRFRKMEGDRPGEFLTRWLDLGVLWMGDGSALYCCTRWDVYPQWKEAIERVPGLVAKNCLVWWKGGGGLGDLAGDYYPDHEFIIYATHGRHILRGARTGNVWQVPKVNVNAYRHPSQKPVDLLVTAMLKSSSLHDLILDPFCGSGTSIIAAQGLGRVVAALEIDQAYCQVAAERFIADSGIEVTVYRDGKAWKPSQLKKERVIP